jgi:hypothetical protein
MKTKKILFLGLSVVAFLFSSCKGDEPVSGVTLDQATVSIMKDDSTTLKATIVPKGAEGTVVWASSNTAVATVKDGVVKGITLGTANITATVGAFTATCAVTIVENTDFSRSLKGTEYYPIIMDGVTADALGNKIKADLRPDDATRHLWIWENTYSAGTSTGPNFYGEVEGWLSLVVGTVGWSGAGFNITTAGNEATLAALKAITDNPSKYFLHIGVKSKDNTVHAIILGGQTEVKFAIGATGFVDNANTYPALGDFTRDGEWHEIEIPMTTLVGMGLSYSNFGANPNIFSFLSGGTAGRTLDLDAVFIYKK